MKSGRNDTCSCGSGKKYKKCCLLKEQNAESGRKRRDTRGEPEEAFDDKVFWAKSLTNMRRCTLDRKPHIQAYYKIRKTHGEIIDAMIHYHDDGKFTQTIDADYTESRHDHIHESDTIHLLQAEFNFETREGTQAFYDMLIYKTAPNMNCITETFIQKHRYRKVDKVEFLYSMLDSKLGLFEITGTDPDEGYAFLREVFTNAEYTIIDVALSGAVNYNQLLLYTRIIAYQGICFGTGLNLAFHKTDRFIQDHIKRHRDDFNPHAEFLRFTQLYNQFSKSPNSITLVPNSL